MNEAKSSDPVLSSDECQKKDPAKQSLRKGDGTNSKPQAPFYNQANDHICPELQCSHQETDLTNPPPTAPGGHDTADTQGKAPSATVAGDAVVPMDPSELAALRQATRHLVQLPRVHSTPVEEHTGDHSAAVLVSGRCPLVPTGMSVLVGDRLFVDWTAVPYSVTREDNC